jgi:heme exporter protein D
MNISDFFHMGGYAFYVWTSYALGFVVLLLNILLPMRNKKQVLRELAAKQRREEKK